MTIFFVDTSAVAKRYIIEQGSAWVLSWIEPAAGNVIIIAELTMVETRSVFMRRVKARTITPAVALVLKNDFLAHARDEYLIVPLDTPIITLAEILVDRHDLRSLDAVQLACALHAKTLLNESIIFVRGDVVLLNAAQAEGLATDNPNAHP